MSEDQQQQLLDLNERLEELYHSLRLQKLDSLANYVAALQREVGSRLV